MSDDQAEIEVSVPADPVYIRVVRLAASGVASLVGLDVEKIEDVKIAVDEMCSTLIEVGTGTPLLVRFAPPANGASTFRVDVEADVDLDAGRDEQRFALSRTILGAIADHHELVVGDDGTGRYSMSMRVESIAGDAGRRVGDRFVESAGASRSTDQQRDDEALAQRFVEYHATGDRAIRDELIARHRWVAERCARRFTQRGEPYDDLLQVAMLGVFKAVERFDPNHGAPFVGFAMPTVLGELRRHFRDATWSVRVPRRAKDLHVRLPAAIERLSQELSRPPTPAELASELDATEEQVLEAIEAGAAYRSSSLDQLTAAGVGGVAVDPSSDITTSDQRDEIARLLDGLPERERRIIYLRFYEEMSQQEIADIVGTSQVHVSRLIRAAVAEMRSRADAATEDLVEE